MEENILHVGLDVGSTTVKIIVMNEQKILYIKIIEGIFQIQKTPFVLC